MSKPPAFPLYAGDFLSDANQMAMTLADEQAMKDVIAHIMTLSK